MSPTIRFFTKETLDAWLDTLIAGQNVVAPSQRGENAVFAPIARADEWLAGILLPKTPAKSILFPPRRPVGEETVEPVLLWGVRPCDLQALDLIDRVFLNQEPVDEVYKRRREALTSVAFACANPADTCFCTRLASHPADGRGADILVTPVDGGFAAKALTDKGEKLLAGHGAEASPAQIKAHQDFIGTCAEQGKTARQLPEHLIEAFTSNAWEEVSEGCVSCGVCSFLCPTCHCFDICDEGREKVILWDCCAFPDFTLMTSGENPRKNRPARMRQRLLHKFDYLPRTAGKRGCVGCGRCINYCPSGLDILASVEVLEGVLEKG